MNAPTSPASRLSGYLWHRHASAEASQQSLLTWMGLLVDAALAARGRAVIALAGGKTPMPLYRAFAQQSRDWSRVHLFPTDERWVARGDAARNETGLAAAFKDAEGVSLHGLLGDEAPTPPKAGIACETLRAFADAFDIVLLGMGEDAHTASLFPHARGLDQAWADDAAPACVVEPDPLPPEAPFARITLSRARLRDTKALALLIQGDAKRKVFESVVDRPVSRDRPISAFLEGLPACQVHWSP